MNRDETWKDSFVAVTVVDKGVGVEYSSWS